MRSPMYHAAYVASPIAPIATMIISRLSDIKMSKRSAEPNHFRYTTDGQSGKGLFTETHLF